MLNECGRALQIGPVKKDSEGKPMKDRNGRLIHDPYQIRVFNTINFNRSMHYNPFAYIHSEKDILKLVTTLIANTKGDGKAGDEFWESGKTAVQCLDRLHPLRGTGGGTELFDSPRDAEFHGGTGER